MCFYECSFLVVAVVSVLVVGFLVCCCFGVGVYRFLVVVVFVRISFVVAVIAIVGNLLLLLLLLLLAVVGGSAAAAVSADLNVRMVSITFQ